MTSKTYCAFLRGVNVNGTRMKMAEVCSLFEQCGLKNVNSVLASGNIIFSWGEDNNELKPLLQAALSEHFGYQAFLFVKEKNALLNLIQANPFSVDPAYHVYGFVGLDGISERLMAEFEAQTPLAGEEGILCQNHFYWRVPKNSTLTSNFGKILGRKNLKDSFTSRNMNTFERVLHKMDNMP